MVHSSIFHQRIFLHCLAIFALQMACLFRRTPSRWPEGWVPEALPHAAAHMKVLIVCLQAGPPVA